MSFFKRLFGFSGKKKDTPETAYGLTDVGKIRKENEDYLLVLSEKNLFIVADGMGGHNAGEVASRNAAESVNNYFTSKLLSKISGNNERIKDEMIKSLLHAHHNIIELAKNKREYYNMGCTAVIALKDGKNLHICHVGDARAYIANNKGMKLLTTDHSLVMTFVKSGGMTMEEARHSPIKNEITQAVGVPEIIHPEYNHYLLNNGDKILLCSDGLWDMLSDDEIYGVVKRDMPVKNICEELIQMANKAGGRDNITVVMSIKN